MSEITELLAGGDAREGPDLAAVFARLYGDLKRLAEVRAAELAPEETLSATGLVHELFLKFSGAEQLSIQNRAHFFACAARAMRQIVIDRSRSLHAGKRGDGFDRVALEQAELWTDPVDLLELDRALVDVGRIDPALCELVELRYFAGLPMPRIAELRGVSLRTAMRDWERARTLLRARLSIHGR